MSTKNKQYRLRVWLDVDGDTPSIDKTYSNLDERYPTVNALLTEWIMFHNAFNKAVITRLEVEEIS